LDSAKLSSLFLLTCIRGENIHKHPSTQMEEIETRIRQTREMERERNEWGTI
jgi:hypothetical protein